MLDGKNARIAPDAVILGTVVLDDIPIESAAGIGGSIAVDPRLRDTDTDPFWYVTVSPWLRTRSVERG